jgi:hypothetical protein
MPVHSYLGGEGNNCIAAMINKGNDYGLLGNSAYVEVRRPTGYLPYL